MLFINILYFHSNIHGLEPKVHCGYKECKTVLLFFLKIHYFLNTNYWLNDSKAFSVRLYNSWGKTLSMKAGGGGEKKKKLKNIWEK